MTKRNWSKATEEEVKAAIFDLGASIMSQLIPMAATYRYEEGGVISEAVGEILSWDLVFAIYPDPFKPLGFDMLTLKPGKSGPGMPDTGAIGCDSREAAIELRNKLRN